MAPEQAEGNRGAIGPAADVYGLGAILYEMLTGQPPFPGDSVEATLDQVRHVEPLRPSRLHAGVPRDLETICLRCLHKEPERRYARRRRSPTTSARTWPASRSARRPGPLERLLRWARRRPIEGVLLTMSVLTVVGFGVGIVWSHALAVGAVAGLSLVVASTWYMTRLRQALAELRRHQHTAERSAERLRLVLEMTRRLMRAPSWMTCYGCSRRPRSGWSARSWGRSTWSIRRTASCARG